MSERIYCWLLKLYPISFRDDYGAVALQLFRDRFKAERGLFQQLQFWIDIVVDLITSVPREWWRREVFDSEAEGAFRISEVTAHALTKRSVASAMLVDICIAVGLTAGWVGKANRTSLFAVYIPLAAISICQLLSLWLSEKAWSGYRLILETDRLRQRHRGKYVTILKSDVIKLNEDQYGLRVFGSRPHTSSIWVPSGLVGYERLREELFQWTGHIGQYQSPAFEDLRIPFFCATSLLPALILVHSSLWLHTLTTAYYAMVVIFVAMNISSSPQRHGGRIRRRITNLYRKPIFPVLLILPALRLVLPG